MLFSCMRAELMKLKRSFIWVVFLILPLISTVMGCANYLQNVDILDSLWYSLWTQTTLFYSNFFLAPSSPFTAPTSGVWKISTTTVTP